MNVYQTFQPLIPYLQSGELEVKNPLFQDDLDNEAETSTSTLKN